MEPGDLVEPLYRNHPCSLTTSRTLPHKLNTLFKFRDYLVENCYNWMQPQFSFQVVQKYSDVFLQQMSSSVLFFYFLPSFFMCRFSQYNLLLKDHSSFLLHCLKDQRHYSKKIIKKMLFPKQNCPLLYNNYCHFHDFHCHFSQIIIIEL